MLSRLRVLLLLPVATLIACGGGSTAPPTGIAFTPVGGDYVITVGVGTANQANFAGDLIVSGSSVTGVFRYNSTSACVTGSQDIPFTGSFSGTTLSLTSASFASGTATFSIKLPLTTNNIGQQIASGTGVITGGSCALASSALQAQLIPSYTANWSANLTDPSPATATLSITESTLANQDGQFPVTASVTITDSACGPATPDSTYTGLISGGTLQLTSATYPVNIIANNTGSPVTISISGDIYGSKTVGCTTVLNGTMSH